MTLAAGFLGGAGGRLLPASLPFRYFGAAAVFHVAMWLVLVDSADQLIRYRGGLVPGLAALHLLALGVLAMTAVGAAAQLLPVATRQALAGHWPIRLTFWLLAPGIAVLAFNMYFTNTRLLVVGAALSAGGLVLFAGLLADNLRRSRSLPIVAAYGWAALAALLLTSVLGPALALDYVARLPIDHAAVGSAHAVLAGYGFMGLLALGFSHVLVPMFALSPAPGRRAAIAGFAVAVAAVVLATAALLGRLPQLAMVAAVLGLGAVAMHLRLMRSALRDGMRKRLGLSFVLIRIAWLALPASIVIGLAALNGRAGPNAPALFGLLLLGGWLLTFLLGILQRILPFLASMHGTGGAVRGIARPSPLGATLPLRIHALCHVAALLILAAAIVADAPGPARIAGMVGLAGSVAFLVFTADVIRRLLPARAAPSSP